MSPLASTTAEAARPTADQEATKSGRGWRSLRIGFLWHCVYPWDVRLEKIANACIEAGHTVCMVSKGRRDLACTEVVCGAEVRRVFRAPGDFPGWAAKIANYPLFLNPAWRAAALNTFREKQVDLIIVRDLPLALLGVRVGKALNKPVILDMAENYPAALIAYQNPLYRPFLFGNAWLPRKYEQLCLQRLQHVFVVAEEQRQRLLALGTDPGKITLVGNTPTASFINSCAGNGNGRTGSGNLNLLYVGKLDVHRGVDLLVRAMPLLLREFPALSLTLVGDGKHKEQLEALVRQLGLGDTVVFPGWVNWNRITDFIQAGTVCVIPHLRCEHTETTLPNKLFDYLALSKPVVASDCRPLQQIIQDRNCGLTFKSGDLESLQATLRSMLLDPAREEKGRNGRRAIEQAYNWEVDKQRLLHAIANVGGGQRV
jgi:glycosyltransferase involved in cell wall biosynthesis